MPIPRIAVAAALLTLVSVPAHAASVAPHRKVRVHLDTEVFAWTHSRPPGSFAALSPALRPANSIGLGFGRPAGGDRVPFGASVIALGVGYGVHRHLLLGARFGANLQTLPRTGGTRSEAFTGTFTPYLQIFPLPQGRVLPFILVRAGITGGLDGVEANGEFQVRRAFAPLVGTGVGAHAFVAKFFSIDFGLTFDYRWLYVLTASGPTSGPPVPAHWTRGSHGFTLAASLGISTWF